MLLNRFTEDLEIVFVSENVDELFPNHTVSSFFKKRLLTFVYPSCREKLLSDITRAKTCNGICHVRFPFRLPNLTLSGQKEVEIEMVVACSSDGLVAVLREFKPMVIFLVFFFCFLRLPCHGDLHTLTCSNLPIG
jgi:hypothetical protein